jgi:hypothetical protein
MGGIDKQDAGIHGPTVTTNIVAGKVAVIRNLQKKEKIGGNLTKKKYKLQRQRLLRR